MPHGADIQEIMLFSFAPLLPQEEQLSRGTAGRSGIDRIFRHMIENDLYGFFPAHGIDVIHVVGLVRIRHHAFRCDEGIDASLLPAVFHRLFDRICEF